MNRLMWIAAAAGLALVAPALADDAPVAQHDRDASRDREMARKAADDALASKADLPAKPPMLPTTASDHARNAHENIAFGKRGEEMRAAHDQAQRHPDDRADMGHHNGRGGGAMMGADNDAHDAADHAREHEGMAGSHDGMPGGTPGGGMQGPSHRH